MQRDPCAYLSEILESAAAIQAATLHDTAETYGSNRIIRPAVQRVFIIGEALRVLPQRVQSCSTAFPKPVRASTSATCSPTNSPASVTVSSGGVFRRIFPCFQATASRNCGNSISE